MRSIVERARDFFVNNTWVIFLLWALWLSLEYFCLGPFSYAQIHDWGDSILPLRLGFIQEFLGNGFSHWSNTAACGLDRLAATGPFFQIDNLFYLTLPAWLACGLITFLQRFIAGYFTYRLCKDYLKLDALPSLVAGLAYSMSFFYFQSGLMGDAGFPFILWSLEYIYISERKNATRYILAFLLGIFVLFSSSFTLSVPFILPMALAWFVLVRRKYSFRFLSLFTIFSITLLVGNIPYIWALLVNAPLSHRADYDFARIFRYQGSLWMVWIKNVFHFINSNIIYLCIGILGLYLSRLKERGLLMVMVLLGFCGVVSRLRKPLSLYVDQYIGFLSGFDLDRFYLLVPFFAAITAAYGLHLLRPIWISTQDNSHNKIKLNYRAQTILCIIVIGLLVVSSFDTKYDRGLEWAGGSSYAVNYENRDLQHIASDNIHSAPFRVGTIAYGLHPAYANAYGLETVDGYICLYSQRYKDFWGKVIEPVTSKDEERYHYFHDQGSRIYLYSPQDGAFGEIEEVPFSEYYNLNLLSLANTKYLISELPITNEHLTLLPSQVPNIEKAHGLSLNTIIQRIRYIVNGKHLYIYENELCFPRFFLSCNVMVFNDSNQLLEAMAKADINSLRNNVFIEEVFVSKIDVEMLVFSHGEITIKQYSPDRIILSVNQNKPGILVFSNSYNPYWICKVNGVEKDIFPAYHTFMGIFLDENENTVVLEYCPQYWSFY